jgi:hypothetical protein
MTLPCAHIATGVSSSVSHCANPDCHAEFKRMGQGTLFVCPSDPEVTVNHLRQRVVWLCDACAREFEMPQIAARQRAYSEAERPHQW